MPPNEATARLSGRESRREERRAEEPGRREDPVAARPVPCPGIAREPRREQGAWAPREALRERRRGRRTPGQSPRGRRREPPRPSPKPSLSPPPPWLRASEPVRPRSPSLARAPRRLRARSADL